MNYQLIRTRRRSVALQVSRAGELVVRAPSLYPKFLIDRFVVAHQRWIDKQLAERVKPKPDKKRFISDTELKSLITQLASHYSTIMSLSPHSLRFRRVRTYWGTCSPRGLLSFNLQLAFTSREAVEYVVVHELAHLRWRGHGPKFWNLVQRIYPDTDKVRTQLRQFPRE